MQVYIHYGSDFFNPYAVPRIHNNKVIPKPEGGLWASREDDEFGWKEWCEDNHFNVSRLRHSFRFTLPDAKILTLSSEDDLLSLPKLKPWEPKDYSEMFAFEDANPGKVPPIELLDRWFKKNPCHLNYEKIAKEYDALEMTHAGSFSDSLPYWDCNSIVVFRPEVIELV